MLCNNLMLTKKGRPLLGARSAGPLLPPLVTSPIVPQKRTYRRRPKIDKNAPRRPKTAYVLFSEHVRSDPDLKGASFTELAKEAGKRWREIPDKQRIEEWEKPAANETENYRAELEHYKLTENYRKYQSYLEDFKREHHETDQSPSDDSKILPILRPDLRETDGPELSPQAGSSSSGTPNAGRSGPVTSGMEEAARVLKAHGMNPAHAQITAYPPEDMTNIAVEAFLHGTGALLYLWDHDEALHLVKSVYDAKSESTLLDATELFAMAAVGSYCDSEAETMTISEGYLNFFLFCLLSASSQLEDIRYMRLFTCLAICRSTSSIDSARILMLSALEIGRKIFASPLFEKETSHEQAYYWWKVFRAIVFMESWLAYNTGREARITHQDLLSSRSVPIQAGFRDEIIHHRVGELGQIAALIALDLQDQGSPQLAQAQLRYDALKEWHRTLPDDLRLNRLNEADAETISWHTKRSLLQLHVLFIGLFIEPYRAFLVDLGNSRLNDSSDHFEDPTLKNFEEQCVSAARQSARASAILQVKNLVRSRCWVSV
ncbi:hypothetical protein BT63DRAFT_152889 [Microthyrium microscopicum]|uniref:HMG box domain-containing protein n=1 Tax=Microthyrium microscopicum TaxID=703497 RepID=A0A6A6UQD0_9PEZI|nr:hypothetical protein BT63DRAFT_152889 [Microthyrium microscopicum]